MNRLAWAMVFVVAATTPFLGQASADGEIIGRITDRAGTALPGPRVSISKGGRLSPGTEELPTGMMVEDALESLGRWAREGQR